MVSYCGDAGVLSELFISGDPFISGFPGPIQRSGLSVQRLFGDDDDDDDVSFFRLFRNPWVRFVVTYSSDGCDQSRDPSCSSEQQMIR